MSKIQELRSQKGLTQEKFAEEMNVDRTTVTKWESGVSIPRPAVLIKMAAFFECTVDELLRKGEVENGKSRIS